MSTPDAASSTLAARASHFVVCLDRSIDSRSGEGVTMSQSSRCAISRHAPRMLVGARQHHGSPRRPLPAEPLQLFGSEQLLREREGDLLLLEEMVARQIHSTE